MIPSISNKVLWLSLLMIAGGVLFSCQQHPKEPLGMYPLKVVEATGYEVPKDSMAPPKIIPVGNPRIVSVEKHKVVSVPANVSPAGNPKVVVAGVPKIGTPGRGGFSLPKIVQAIDSPIVAGLPKIIPAMEALGIDPDPQNFSSFNKLQGLQYGNIQSIIEDKIGNLWFGTKGCGAVKYDGHNFSIFTENEGLGNNKVSCLFEDKNGNLWFGTWGGGVTKYDGQYFTRFTTKEGLSNDYVFSITEDRSGNLWIGTLEGGVSKYDGKSFTHFTTKQGLSHNIVSCIAEDKNGNLWFGTKGGGVTRYDGKKFTHFTEKQGLSNVILSILADQSGNLWFGTLGSGITKYNGKTFTHFTEEEGLNGKTVGCIMEDKRGNLWFGTSKGLSKLTLTRQAEIAEKIKHEMRIESGTCFTNYTAEDGGIGAGLNSIFEANNGTIWVSTGYGLTAFNPDELKADAARPNLQLTNLALFNENIAWADLVHKKDTSFMLRNGVKLAGFELEGISKWYNVPQGLSLAHNNNYITFNFTDITLQSPKLVKYLHQLEGLENTWSALTTDNEATYGNLPPGTYTFKVKAINKEGGWSKELRYTFTIRPPWWRTWWAYLCYIGLIGGSLFAFYRFELKRRLQQAEALRLKELDAVKTKLYTNITHEFRTPLTVILGMAHQVLGNPKDHYRDGLNMIIRNGQNLLTLVNQMLDLSKLETGRLTLHFHRADMVSFLQYIVESFHSLAENKGVQLHFIPEEEQLIMNFDEVRMQQIVTNILSNAIKFTPKGGHVYIASSTKNDRFILKIKDTGIGIAEADLPLIFDRFYQSDGTHKRQGEGTGIGLALTRELVKLMEGTIAAKSHEGKGAEFEVSFPLWHILDGEEKPVEVPFLTTNINKEAPVPIDDHSLSALTTQVLTDHSSVNDTPHILIADNNKDVRAYLASCLNNDYVVEIAKNRQECEDLAFSSTPDLIVLDVMMPFKDGFEVCKTLKTDERTSHIPIIMLTAKADLDSRLEGLEQGADDYLTKPFHKKELLLRIRNLLELRRQLQQYYRSRLEASFSEEHPTIAENPTPSSGSSIPTAVDQDSKNPSIPLANNLENVFVIKVRKTIEAHFDAPDFDVAKLCRSLAMSHSQVHRKLSALTGLSATHFIRYVRLEKAKELIINSRYSIAAIAMDCGFNDPAYFSRVFKQEFGVSPQVWREQNSG